MAIYGTRPEAIKMAPLINAIDSAPEINLVVAVTAQHREMLDQVNALFGIQPDIDLDILQSGQSLTEITTRALDGLVPAIAAVKPDAVVVQGDTTTTFVGALAAFYQQVPVVHLEAGLRTYNRYSPYPEEINRRLTSQLSSLHLAPTPASRSNLLREGVDPKSVVVTGNTVIDALLATVRHRVPYGNADLEALDGDPRRVVLVTAHRRESWGQAMHDVGHALAELADDPEIVIVFPVHRNPIVREAILPPLAGRNNIVITEPLDYGAFVRIMNRASIIITDSGGVQEEGPSLGKPVLVMRDTTERPEAVTAGTARLVGTDRQTLVAATSRLLYNNDAYNAMATAVNPYGDGKASDRSVAAIAELLGVGRRIADFSPSPDQC